MLSENRAPGAESSFPSEKMLLLFASFVFFSAPFWMTDTIDYLAWSIFEVLATLLFLQVLWSRQTLALPSVQFFIPWLAIVFWVALSLFWSANFHATLTSLYKVVFITLMLVNFLNNSKIWET